jgi:GAF domain-containing protein
MPVLPPVSTSILERLRGALGAAPDRDAAMREVVRLLSGAHPHFTWTGIYLLEGDTLVLHNQVGAPTPHERIPVVKGICGLAAREGRTVVVPDVTRDPRFLACSLSTRSEIVVPIQRDDRVFGEIDVDSDQPDAFDDADRLLLEAVAADLARLF